MKLLKVLKDCKDYRKEYRIKPTIKFNIDNDDYLFSFLPTIVWQPWAYRFPNCCVVDVWWLHFHILIGNWERIED